MSPILTVPHPPLRQIAKPVIKLDRRILDIIRDLVATLKAAKNPEGVSLAAPQIGVPLRVFLIRPLPARTITIFINPEIIKFSHRLQSPKTNHGVYEGCLSLPGHYAPITRSMSVTIKWGVPQDGGDMIEKTATFTGFPAYHPARN
ncbi:peptide deformylase [Candidatus Amesbacteria bacterium]|nr:peptide deformylase [Candidatus Amesbacteria bacterium]